MDELTHRDRIAQEIELMPDFAESPDVCRRIAHNIRKRLYTEEAILRAVVPSDGFRTPSRYLRRAR